MEIPGIEAGFGLSFDKSFSGFYIMNKLIKGHTSLRSVSFGFCQSLGWLTTLTIFPKQTNRGFG